MWLCALPLVGILILPFFGVQVALAVAAGLFIVMLAACYAICAWPKHLLGGEDDHAERPGVRQAHQTPTCPHRH